MVPYYIDYIMLYNNRIYSLKSIVHYKTGQVGLGVVSWPNNLTNADSISW